MAPSAAQMVAAALILLSTCMRRGVAGGRRRSSGGPFPGLLGSGGGVGGVISHPPTLFRREFILIGMTSLTPVANKEALIDK
jgi:hypothetical protein